MDNGEIDALVARARAGDESALTALLERCAPALGAGIAPRIPDRWRASIGVEDIISIALTDAFLNFHLFVPRGDGAFVAWLETIARRCLFEAIRGLRTAKRGGQTRITSLEAVFDAQSALLSRIHPARTATSPVKNAALREAIPQLHQALAKLPEKHRLVLQHYDLEGRSAQETAAALGISLGAMYVLRNRALTRLSALMAGLEIFFSTRA